ncbi:hypothetical protein HanPI659440_Chr13g0513061 [Helianthus annuus]|nr:hypothetical protein HanPI659440_Chr13g0513061 [Helianthus annuus]
MCCLKQLPFYLLCFPLFSWTLNIHAFPKANTIHLEALKTLLQHNRKDSSR